MTGSLSQNQFPILLYFWLSPRLQVKYAQNCKNEVTFMIPNFDVGWIGVFPISNDFPNFLHVRLLSKKFSYSISNLIKIRLQLVGHLMDLRFKFLALRIFHYVSKRTKSSCSYVASDIDLFRRLDSSWKGKRRKSMKSFWISFWNGLRPKLRIGFDMVIQVIGVRSEYGGKCERISSSS